MYTDPFSPHIQAITLTDVLPEPFDNDEGRAAVAASEVMLAGRVTLERGRHYCLEASSGTGKTSLCSFIYGQRRDYLGTIDFDGRAARSLSVADWCELRRRHIAYLPQELDIFGELTAADNVRLKNRLTDCKTDTEIRRMFEALEIDNLFDRSAARVSVGQRQRVALVRALCQPFDFIILDEPVSHLDEHNNALCSRLIETEAAAQGASVIFTSVGNPLALGFNYKTLRL